MTDNLNTAFNGRQRVHPTATGRQVRAPQRIDPRDPQERKAFDQERKDRAKRKKR